MYRFLARMTPDDIEDVAALAYVEMLEAGFTTVGEFHYLHNAANGSPYAAPESIVIDPNPRGCSYSPVR